MLRLTKAFQRYYSKKIPVQSVSLFKDGHVEIQRFAPAQEKATQYQFELTPEQIQDFSSSVNFKSSVKISMSHGDKMIQSFDQFCQTVQGSQATIDLGDEKISGTLLPFKAQGDEILVSLLNSKQKILTTEYDDIKSITLSKRDGKRLAQALSKTRNVNVVVGANKDCQLSYIIEGGKWACTYQIDIEKESTKFQAFAVIENQTEEDWTDIKATLVTGDPNLEYFKLKSQRNQEQTLSKRSGHVQEMLLLGDYDYKPQKSGTLYFSELSEPITVPSNSSTIVPLLEKEGVEVSKNLVYKADASYQTHPDMSIVIKNTTSAVLESGYINIYMNNRLIGQSMLQALYPNQKMELNVGKDRDITVSNKTRKISRTVTNVQVVENEFVTLTCNVVEKREWKVINRSDQEQTMELVSQLYEKQEIEPPVESQVVNETIRYKITLAPNEEKLFTHSITSSEDSNITLSSIHEKLSELPKQEEFRTIIRQYDATKLHIDALKTKESDLLADFTRIQNTLTVELPENIKSRYLNDLTDIEGKIANNRSKLDEYAAKKQELRSKLVDLLLSLQGTIVDVPTY